jgi:hypothetical protein
MKRLETPAREGEEYRLFAVELLSLRRGEPYRYQVSFPSEFWPT